jgi:hypothetical protein
MTGLAAPSRSVLLTDSRFPDPDAAFRLIVGAQRGLTDEDAANVQARLLLLLANHIGDMDVLREAIELARRPST